MEKDFIPYEEALAFRELGFDEPCMSSRDINNGEGLVQLPLYQQAFRWLRDKKLSDCCICRYQSRDDGGIYYYYVINDDFGIEETRHFKEGFYTYEEAELACLRKLIELVKQKP